MDIDEHARSLFRAADLKTLLRWQGLLVQEIADLARSEGQRAGGSDRGRVASDSPPLPSVKPKDKPVKKSDISREGRDALLGTVMFISIMVGLPILIQLWFIAGRAMGG